jgi:hypothetical protein
MDASCQVWLHFAKQFQRRRFFLTVANQKQELPLSAIFVGGTGRYDVHVTLPSLVPFGPVVSEEKIKI